ncbi:MAG: FAD-dependent oxidoreductase, partial [Planctomycetota bacterium]
MTKKIVIIGGGTAGASAALTARKINRTAEITVLEQEPFPTYSRCGLPFVIKGIIPELENLIVFSDKFFRQQKIVHIKNSPVVKINPGTKEVITEIRIPHSEFRNYNYDSLVIATGASSVKSPVTGVDLPHVFTLRTINDAQRIINHQSSVIGHQTNAVVIGASFIGIELAEALKSKGYAVTLVEVVRLMWRTIDPDIGQLIKQYLNSQGINIIEQKSVTEIKAKEVSVKDDRIPAELVVVATGVKPEIRLAQEAGLEIGITGGIKVNNHLQACLLSGPAINNIYAAGDCAEVTSAITNEPIVIGLGTIAARQGVVAGTNAAGGDQKAPPVLNSAVLKVFGMEIGSVGFTEEYLRKNHPEKFHPVSMTIKYPSLPHYYPGGVDIHVKLIADKKTHQL